MLHPLEQKLVALRRRVRPMAVLHGLCIVATALLGRARRDGAARLSLPLPGSRPADHRLARRARPSTAGPSTATFSSRSGCGSARSILPSESNGNFPVLGDQLVTAVEFLHTADDDPGGRLRRPAPHGHRPSDRRGRIARFLADPRPASRRFAPASSTALAYVAAVVLLRRAQFRRRRSPSIAC